MASALRPELAIVAIAQQRVVVGVRLEINVAAVAAVAARRAAARDVLLPAERHAAVAAVARLYQNFGFVNKHETPVPRGYSSRAYATTKEKNKSG